MQRRRTQLNRKVAIRIELCGRLVHAPSLRVTPAGTAVLSVVVDCGAQVGELLMPVVMAGESARALAGHLSQGLKVRACGSLRPSAVRSRAGTAAPGVEVLADHMMLAGGSQ
jgi:primosomal replication protein N